MPDNLLAILIDLFIARGGASPQHMVGAAAARREGAGGPGGKGTGRVKGNYGGTMLSASWEAAVAMLPRGEQAAATQQEGGGGG